MTGAPPDLRIAVRLHDARLRDWGFPRWGSAGAAGLDLHACLDAPVTLLPQAPPVLVPAGFSVRIGDPDWCALVVPRSGLGHRSGLVLGNTVGVVDADYEGPLLISAWNRNPPGAADADIVIAPGDRIAQLVFTRVVRPQITILDGGSGGEAPGTRGTGGFGSTGIRP
ncbi:aminotransferase [Methylobacterium sp. Leaf399]|uniref:dUTP diphosphatase n=1 Tax=unclassified Methylobacterium TaxID=2615210 RepID=UPI0006F81D55|nr:MULTISPECIES: dUTP diphosphatase [unclassified Methylobacterium]KQP55098.1 aminotransferase [Methylobacterium sp. Leaf108]KQT09836.1 aminotransferase [Methylobacterium sp. Leaf399]KQT77928.1 aminotransferase [Methylobacterium sp. Leaf466]